MKIAVTAQGSGLASELDPRFGRARYFVVVDMVTGEVTTTDNSQNLNAAQGAGIQAARNVSEIGVEAVVTGHVGPKAFRALTAAGIKIYTGAQGTVADALADYRAGRLAIAGAADVEGHWS